MKATLTTGVPFDEYQCIPGISWSALSHIRTSPLDFRHNLLHPKPATAKMNLGSAIHAATLEPHVFEATYGVYDGKRGTNAYAEWQEDNPGRIDLKPDEWEQVLGAAHAVRRALQGKQARRILRVCKAEVTLRWTDPTTRTRCKARPDLVGPGVLADLKSTGSVDEHTFGRLSGDMGYHGKMAFASLGLEALGRYPAAVFIIAVEQTAPHDVAVFELDAATRDRAESDVAHYLRTLQACRRAKRWPGRYQNVMRLDIGDWNFEPEEFGEFTGEIGAVPDALIA